MATQVFQQDEGELESFRLGQASSPDKYIDSDDKSLLEIDLGQLHVHGCPCGAEVRHEQWIWAHRRQILEYLRTRTDAALASAQRDASAVQGVVGLIAPV